MMRHSGIVFGRRHFNLTDLELTVQVRQLAPGVLEEELPLQQKRCAEHVHEEHGKRGEECRPIRMDQDGLVGSHELQLVEEPESVSEQDSDGQQERVGNHLEILGFRDGVLTRQWGFRERAESGAKRRPF